MTGVLSDGVQMRVDYQLVNGRSLFVLTYEPSPGSATCGTVIFVQSLFDEMNRSRPLIAVCARELTRHGWRVVLPDLYGCGDSAGNLEEATLGVWAEDLLSLTTDEALKQPATAPIVLWGLRFGGLLATQVSTHFHCSRLVLWSPALNGEQFIDQLLRMRSLANEPGVARESRSELWALLRDGQSLEVGGYLISPELALPIAAMRLSADAPKTPVVLRHFALQGTASGESVYGGLLNVWRQGGANVDFNLSDHGPFWRQVGLTAMLDATSWLSDFDL